MDHLPDQTVNRLPVYLRCLNRAHGEGLRVINSLQLGVMVGTNGAQVRKDLSYLGELGTRGIGYEVEALISHLSDCLGLTQKRRVAIVGSGRLGSALLSYEGFMARGFDIVAAFDADPARVGSLVDRRGVTAGGLTVRPIDHFEDDLRDLGVDIVILATPAGVAQDMAERIAEAGVRAILNFTPLRIRLSPDVRVRDVDLSIDLQVLSFYLATSS
jgi:redox-sensing transcriptional repressor